MQYLFQLFVTNFVECPKGEVRRILIPRTLVNTASRDAQGSTAWHDRDRLGKRLGGCRCMWKRNWRNAGSRFPKLPSSPGGAAIVRLGTGAPRPRLRRRTGSLKPG